MYAVALCGWFVLRLQRGDTLPWLALANALALYLFLPLLLFIPLVLFTRRLILLPCLLIPLALFFFLFGAQFLPRASRALADKPLLRVMTFNVFGNSDDPELVTTIIESTNPDVLFIQELSPRHSFELTAKLGNHYPFRQFEPLYGRRGIGILSRYPIDSQGWLGLGKDPYAAQRATLEWQGQKINLINVHLESTMPGEDIETSFRERETQLRQLLDLIASDPVPTIVAGDFNMTDTTQGYALFSSELNDAHRDAGWGLGLTFPTNPEFLRTMITFWVARSLGARARTVAPLFRWLYLPPLPLLRIDYVFYTRPLNAINTHVAAWDGQSDHRAVITELQLLTP